MPSITTLLTLLPIVAQGQYPTIPTEGRTAQQAAAAEDANAVKADAANTVSNFIYDTLFQPIYDAMAEFTNIVLEAISSYWMNLSVAPIFRPPVTDNQGITTPGTYDQLFANTNQGALAQVSNG